MTDNKKSEQPRWTEIEHLPEWDEEFYHVYTAKKFGKWVMLKTLRPEYKDLPEYREMIEKEFDVRYNLANPNIIMINDFEDVPGIGRCIITDDVYGNSLRKLIDQKKITQHHINALKTNLVSAIDYIQKNHIVHHPIRPETIIFTENIENLKLIDVGFDQKKNLTPFDTRRDIQDYGKVVKEVLDKSEISDPAFYAVAERCLSDAPSQQFRNLDQLRMAIENRSASRFYIIIIVFLSLMTLLLAWLASPFHPEAKVKETTHIVPPEEMGGNN